jgi:hypothetical protein
MPDVVASCRSGVGRYASRTTPELNLVEPMNSRRTGPTPSKIRGPVGHTDGFTQNQNSPLDPG